jgi:ligand-binding sensor domain-containing protein
MVQILPEPKEISLITTDFNGTVWISTNEDIYQFIDDAFSNHIFHKGFQTSKGTIINQSTVVNFGKEAYFYQPDKLPIPVNEFLRRETYLANRTPFVIDQQNRLWFYAEENGLTILDHDELQSLGKFSGDGKEVSNLYLVDENRVWLSTPGSIWEYVDDTWQQFALPDANATLTQFTQGIDGTIYGASNTKVYQFQDETVRKFELPVPGKNALYLGTHNDGSIIYIDNQLVARFVNGKWQSFLFENIGINSATMDHDGNIWLYTDQVVLRLDSDVFEDYRPIPTEISH